MQCCCVWGWKADRALHLLFSRFTGSAGTAVVSKASAYLVTDSRYWLQAEDELDDNAEETDEERNDGREDTANELEHN